MPDQIATGNEYTVEDARSNWIASNPAIRMNGTVNITGVYFDVPLITQVPLHEEMGGGLSEDAELWQGGCIGGVPLDEDFDYVLSLYPWEKYRLMGEDTQRNEVKMYDSVEQATGRFEELALVVIERLRAGEKVLIHCQAGLNRSGTVAAAVLIKLGMNPSDALDLLRKSRGTDQVVCNPTFAAWLGTLEPGA